MQDESHRVPADRVLARPRPGPRHQGVAERPEEAVATAGGKDGASVEFPGVAKKQKIVGEKVVPGGAPEGRRDEQRDADQGHRIPAIQILANRLPSL